MNDHEAERIAAAMNQLRPDWPVKSILTLLSRPELASRARRDVTVALAWVACESGTSTPKRVIENGPWWKAANIENTLASRHPKPDEACRRCGQMLSASCCDKPAAHPEPRGGNDEAIAASRTLLASRTPAVSPLPVGGAAGAGEVS